MIVQVGSLVYNNTVINSPDRTDKHSWETNICKASIQDVVLVCSRGVLCVCVLTSGPRSGSLWLLGSVKPFWESGRENQACYTHTYTIYLHQNLLIAQLDSKFKQASKALPYC